MGVNASYLGSGRLEHGGTTFGSAFPHGGTDLGVFSRLVVEPVTYSERVVREEDNATDEVLLFGSDLVLSFRLEEWSADAIAALFPSSRLDTGDRIITWPYAAQAAPTLTPLVFSPRNTAEHPALIVFNAEVVAAREVRNPLSATRHLTWDFLVYGTPNGSGNVGEMGLLSKLNTS
jgi:hypothetical protein